MSSRLPASDRAFIQPEKITAYLLSPSHSLGAAKAGFFESFGFKPDKWIELRDAFVDHAKSGPVVGSTSTPYGQTYEVNGPLTTPDGRNPYVLVVWIVRTGEDFPRLVTAVPSEERSL
jgi:hypothetical protein